MTSTVPPVRPIARLIFCVLGSLTAVALIVIVAVPVDLMTGFIAGDETLLAMAAYLRLLTPISLVAGLLGPDWGCSPGGCRRPLRWAPPSPPASLRPEWVRW